MGQIILINSTIEKHERLFNNIRRTTMKGQNTSKTVYTVDEIRTILNISKNTAYSFIKNDPPFSVKKVGDSYRIIKSSFDKWLYSDHNI